MRINDRNVALQDINEHSAIAVEGVHQISSKDELYTKAGLDFEVAQVNPVSLVGNETVVFTADALLKIEASLQ